MNIPRFMVAAPSSGSGKTLITCGLLRLLTRRGLRIASFKCGPDFIDPMFHTKVLGTKSRNLDTFFTGEAVTRYLLEKNADGCDLAVMEGVMGYFDGLGLDSSRAGASDLAGVTDTPVLLIVPAKGASRSILPLIKGFLDFQEKPNIRGVILNRVNAMLYPRLKEMIERELEVQVIGYVPPLSDCVLESRHLGLLLPDEIDSLQEKLDRLADHLERSIDVKALLELAGQAPALDEKADRAAWDEVFAEETAFLQAEPEDAASEECEKTGLQTAVTPAGLRGLPPLRIGLARDEAFCFFYEDNLQLLREMGAELVEFSPIHDRALPEDLDGLLLHGGYPELHLRELEANGSMRRSIREAIASGLPTMAECGGFLYLHETLEDSEGRTWQMAGVLPGRAYYTGHLNRFGYTTLSEGRMFGQDPGDVRTHEFHYYESEDPGTEFFAQKPSGGRSWRCIHSRHSADGTAGCELTAGFPHMYYHAAPGVAAAFLRQAACRRKTRVPAGGE